MKVTELIGALITMQENRVLRPGSEVYITDTGRETLCPTLSVEVDADCDVRIVATGNIL